MKASIWKWKNVFRKVNLKEKEFCKESCFKIFKKGEKNVKDPLKL